MRNESPKLAVANLAPKTLSFSQLLLALVALALPLKLSLAYVFLIPLVLKTLWDFVRDEKLRNKARHYLFSPFLAPYAVFLIYLLLASLFGMNITKSLQSGSSLIFFSVLLVSSYCYVTKDSQVLILALLALGQAIAASHSIVESAFPEIGSRLFLGPVTESGQLSITLLIAAGLTLTSLHSVPNSSVRVLGWGSTFMTLTLILLGFHRSFSFISARYEVLCTLLLMSVLIVIPIFIRAKVASSLLSFYYALLIVPLLIAALVVNLKRGPWLGVTVGVTLFCLLIKLRRLALIAPLGLVLLLLLPPARERIASGIDHFFISGGRSELWEIGMELSQKFPLGIGFENSALLHEYTREVPPELRHFHNNILNVLAELGWPGVVLLTWWLLNLIIGAVHSPEAATRGITVALACSLVSWQIAGTVEYNAGDSEVLYMVFIVIGVLSSIMVSDENAENTAVRLL